MEDFDLDKWVVCWTPATGYAAPAIPGAVLVKGLGDRLGSYIDDQYAHTGGCCFFERKGMSYEKQIMMMFIDFHTLVVCDGIDPQAAHRQFLNIKEYRRRIARAIDGAEDLD